MGSGIRLAAQQLVHELGVAHHVHRTPHVAVGAETVFLAARIVVIGFNDGGLDHLAYLRFPADKVEILVVVEFLLECIQLFAGLGLIALETGHLAEGLEQAQALAVVAEVALLHETAEVGVLLRRERKLGGRVDARMLGTVADAVVEELLAVL